MSDPLIVRSKGGTAERTVRFSEIEWPDLWHIAMRLPEPARSKVLEAWHLLHDLHNHIEELPEEVPHV